MIRKIFMLVIVFALFLYTASIFYSDALRYNPLSGASEQKFTPREGDLILSSNYSDAWSEDIYKKNLFNPYRTYKPNLTPVQTGPAQPPPRRPELALKGIVLDTFGDYVAYIEIDRAKPVALRKGDKIKDIEIEDISARKVMVKWNAEEIKLSMDKIKTIKNPGKRR